MVIPQDPRCFGESMSKGPSNVESSRTQASGRCECGVRVGGRVARAIRVAELFAGVGGFRLGLEGYPQMGVPGSGWRVVWSNQWEPATKTQHASGCYVRHFGLRGHVNDDIAKVLDDVEQKKLKFPEFELLVGGFPCQDYSVARVLSQAAGLEGRKGVLWWEIHRMLRLQKPRFLFLENVDRLLKSPATQRGRDFGVMLRCLADLGYLVEWRVVNAADYGFPQRRRRVFIVGELERGRRGQKDPVAWLLNDGVLAKALPIVPADGQVRLLLGEATPPNAELPKDTVELSKTFAATFENAGVMRDGKIWTLRVRSEHAGSRIVLRDVLQNEDDVPKEFFIPRSQMKQWRYLKGAKREERVVERNGFRYFYSEGAVAFPEPLDEPSRTILTGEGGPSPSRFKHVVRTPSGRYRRLTPVELERLDGFPDGWTEGMPAARRAFMVGNALVVGVIQRIGAELAERARPAKPSRQPVALSRMASGG